jgi:hypothetical protein
MLLPRFFPAASSELNNFGAEVVDECLHGNDAGADFWCGSIKLGL